MFKKILAIGTVIAALGVGLSMAYAQECTSPKALTEAATEAGAEEIFHIAGKDVGTFRQVIAEIAGVSEADVTPFDEVKIYFKDTATTILFALFQEGCLSQPVFLAPEQAMVIIKRYKELRVANGE